MKLEILDITAYSKKEAIQKALESGFTKLFDASRSYHDARINADFNTLDFAENKLRKELGNAPGLGYVVAITAGVPETRTNLYDPEIESNNDPVSYKLIYEVVELRRVDDVNQMIVHSMHDHKADAKKAAKQQVNKSKTTIHVRKVKHTVPPLFDHQGGDFEAFTLTVKYKPSEKAMLGKYLIFGYVN